MVGASIYRRFKEGGYTNIITRSHAELDLMRQADVQAFFETEKPEYVIIAAAKVGGILANNIYRAQFLYENLMIQANLIHESYRAGVKKLVFLGSSCIYPKLAHQPISEDSLLTGFLEPTNEPYAIAKIAGLKMCENYYRQYGCNFFSVMPCNLYGPFDNFNLKNSHVIPALLRKIHLAKCIEQQDWDALRKDLNFNPVEGIDGTTELTEILEVLSKHGIYTNPSPHIDIWGTGKVLREFLFVEDLADAVHFLFENYDLPTDPKESDVSYFFNAGTGEDISIEALAYLIKKVTQYSGEFTFDASKPDGTPRKVLNVDLLHSHGWKHATNLETGIERMYQWYLEAQNESSGKPDLINSHQ